MAEDQEPEGQLYRLVITATGEVRDAEGNLLNTVPVEQVLEVTADEAERIMKGLGQT